VKQRRRISKQKDILGKKVKPDYEVSSGLESDVEIVATFTLQGKQMWTGENILSLVGSYEKFKKNVFILAERDQEYKYWLQTTGQDELANEWGVDQSTISRLIGPIQKEHKNELKSQVKLLRSSGMSIKDIITELKISADESTVSRWLKSEKEHKKSKPKVSFEGSTEYDLKIYRLEDELSKEKQKNEIYRKKIKQLKMELSRLRAKYEDA
jgi:hypothetical protein